MSKTDLPILEQRRIEANIIKPIYAEMVSQIGKQKATEILRAAITRNSIEHGQAYAASEGGETTLEGFHKLLPQWKANGALEDECRQDRGSRQQAARSNRQHHR